MFYIFIFSYNFSLRFNISGYFITFNVIFLLNSPDNLMADSTMAEANSMQDPRAEVVAASRHRSGSTLFDITVEVAGLSEPANDLADNVPTKSSVPPGRPSTFLNLRSRFEDKDNSAGSGNPSKMYGPSVSRIKEKFQHPGGGSSGGGMEAGGTLSASVHQSVSRPPVSSSTKMAATTRDESPEIKRKKSNEHSIVHPSSTDHTDISPALDPNKRLPSIDGQVHVQHPPLSPTHQDGSVSLSPRRRKPGDSNNSDNRGGPPSQTQDSSESSPRNLGPIDQLPVQPKSHLQRFNLTRALFARMEEETRIAQQKEQVARHRKLSPSRVIPSSSSGTSSPLLSPTSMSPSQDSKKFPTSNAAGNRRSRSTPEAPNYGNLAASSDDLNNSSAENSLGRRVRSSSSGSGRSPFGSTDSIDVDVPVTVRSRRPLSGSDYNSNGNFMGDRVNKYNEKEKGEEAGSQMHSKRLSDSSATKGSTSNKVMEEGGSISQGDKEIVEPAIEQIQSNNDLESAPLPATSVQFDHSHRARSSHISGPKPVTAGLSASSRLQQHLSSSSLSSTSSSLPSSHSRPGNLNHYNRSSSASMAAPAPSLVSSTVRMRSSKSGVVESTDAQGKKRLSKEEIEAALERADSYLANLGSPDGDEAQEGGKSASNATSTTTTGSSTNVSKSRKKFSFEEEATDSLKSETSSDVARASDVPVMMETMVAIQAHAQHSSLPSSFARRQEEDSPSQASSSSSLFPHSSISQPLPAGVGSASTALMTSQSPSSSTSSLLSSSTDALFDTPPVHAPPSYRESTAAEKSDPPSYNEAILPSSKLVSQKVMQQQQQQQQEQLKKQLAPSPKPALPARPTPIPRRAAPPPPPSKKPIGDVFNHPGAPPPPAPEPGTVEYKIQQGKVFQGTPGSRHGMLLNPDDLIMPEEHMQEHLDDE